MNAFDPSEVAAIVVIVCLPVLAALGTMLLRQLRQSGHDPRRVSSTQAVPPTPVVSQRRPEPYMRSAPATREPLRGPEPRPVPPESFAARVMRLSQLEAAAMAELDRLERRAQALAREVRR